MGDLDRRKHDVDVHERVLGGVQDRLSSDEPQSLVFNVTVPSTGGSRSSIVEVVVNLSDEGRPRSDRDRE
jgi:hypothetical protein